ncbi:hypothetical protein EDB81DRAFT_835241 [Dactylonectria macrodidyma]|uniref:Zn(2)-C6 fungal-type domain-containing protein n=1 Tax=Dactylonectria macrodidyma TaxID=307937 RepID=A0A9P9CXT0_9HYPO|nr:hypothetical protein EDB81DRAFT_835241 [Dactylonectria macrodidyma]
MPARKVKPWERRRCVQACTNCKHRKERCDGQLPCGRCSVRGAVDQCTFTRSPRPPNSLGSSLDYASRAQEQNHGHGGLDLDRPLGPVPLNLLPIHHLSNTSPTSSQDPANVPVPQPVPSIQGRQPTAISVRDSANLSFLQIIRRLVHDSLGPGVFVQDASENTVAEVAASAQPDWAQDMAKQPPQRPEPFDAHYLVRWYLRATNSILILFDEPLLNHALSQWLQTPIDQLGHQPMTTIFFLIFAIGSQTCPENRDNTAEKYFNYGRFLTGFQNVENPTISTIQAHVLITMYLLGASRRDAADMYLGIAVRAGYVLGIHRSDINAQSHAPEYATRERLWKVLRVLDLFMSTSLGHPPSTCETRDTTAEDNYSPSNDLCAIFEAILNNVYSSHPVSKEALERISGHHRQWTKRYAKGLAADDIKSTEFIDTDEGKRVPNIGLYQIKEAYYWTIMLLARPFLLESISRHVSRSMANDKHDEHAIPRTSHNSIMSYACVDSAIRTVDLLNRLRSSGDIPKRLPFVVNSLFVASLVLGLAGLGDLDSIFPLGKSLKRARRLLARFSQCDAVSKRNLAIVDDLRVACDLHREKRFRRKMEQQGLLVGGFFGFIHDDAMQQQPFLAETSVPSEPSSGPITDTEENFGTNQSDSTSSAGSETQGYLDFGVEGMMPDFAYMTNLALSLSPRTLVPGQLDLGSPFSSDSIPSPLQLRNMLDGDYGIIDLGNQEQWCQ